MKKLMGVSIVAMLAVMPMMAKAAVTYSAPTTATDQATAPTTTANPKFAGVNIADDDAQHIASTAYVKGAYNSTIAAINKVATDAAGNLSGAAGNGLAFDTTAKKFNADLDTAAGLGFDTATDGSRKIQIKTGNGVQFDANGAIAAKVNANMLTVDSTNGIGIADAGVDSTQLKDSAVISAKIADSAVVTNKINDYAVTADKLNTNSVTTAKIADDAVVTAKIADYNVTTDKIDSYAVDSSKLDTDAVTTEKIADLNVARGKIANYAIDDTKLDTAAVKTDKIDDGAVTSGKIAANAVTYEKLDTGLVQSGVRSATTAAAATDSAAYAADKTVASEKAVASAIDSAVTTLESGVVSTINRSTVSIYTTWLDTATQPVYIDAAAYGTQSRS